MATSRKFPASLQTLAAAALLPFHRGRQLIQLGRSRASIAAEAGPAKRDVLLAALISAALVPGLATAQIITPTSTATSAAPQARLVEWDIPAVLDASPGAIVVDSRGDDDNRLWFVTHIGSPPRVFRFDPARSLMSGPARSTSWDLADDSLFTGGVRRLRPSRDRRFVFVRTLTSLQRIDTQRCSFGTPQTCGDRTEWNDQQPPPNPSDNPTMSDVAVDDFNNVFTTANLPLVTSTGVTIVGYLQKVNGGAFPATGTSVNVTRWGVDGGAGFCRGNNGINDPCISGVAVESTGRLVYYSEGIGNNIGELNTATNRVRRWSLADLEVALKLSPGTIKEPRQVSIDRSGKVWVVTGDGEVGSGHLVSLIPSKNLMTAHQIPLVGNDPFGVAPDDDVVGYTGTGTDKVGMLFPRARAVTITPSQQTITPVTVQVPVTVARADITTDSPSPKRKIVNAMITRDAATGDVFVEAIISSNGNDSTLPLGITPNISKAEGTFFYAVGQNMTGTNRVGFARLPLPEKTWHPRDDDDDSDGTGNYAGRCCTTNDDDSDGIENAHDDPTAREIATAGNATMLLAGQTASYSFTASTSTLALIAIATADDPLAQIGVEIYNSLGALVASAAATPGAAAATLLLPAPGTYTATVRNWGATAFTQTPTLIVRQPWP